jgi:hypothetical protein
MPTGYTADIHDGKNPTFREFALTCARNFGALVMLRDQPLTGDVPPKFEPSPHYAKQLKAYQEELAQCKLWSDKTWEREAYADFEKDVAYYRERQAESDRLRKDYTDMLRQVKAWTPPTPDHQGMKDFMIEQLESSIEHDCYNYEGKAVLRTPQEYKALVLNALEKNVVRYMQYVAEEEERTAGRNDWVERLVASLPEK